MNQMSKPHRTTLGPPGCERLRKLHFVGIGGAGMSGIAEVLLQEGYRISGSDAKASSTTDYLASLGAEIFIGHRAAQIEGADVLVVSAAISEENSEVKAARQKRLPIVARAQMLAELMRLRFGIAVAGTHGKTTTTSLLASILAEGGLDPTFVIGGKLNAAGSNAKLGTSAYLVAEADESDASFLYLQPRMAIVTNIDDDHLETYEGQRDKLHQTFLEFLHHLPFYGLAVVCVDDPGVRAILPRMARPVLTYGFSEDADIQAKNCRFEGLKTFFELQRPGRAPLLIELNLSGEHNILNALAAIAIATELGVLDGAIQAALKQFKGVGRRFQVLGSYREALVIDDYGHHPRELSAVMQAARRSFPGRRLVLVFQPHRFTRTRDLFQDFVEVLEHADALCVLPIYAAGEAAIENMNSQVLAQAIQNRGRKDPCYVASKEALFETLATLIQAEDILLMCGAGDIGQMSQQLVG